MMDIESFIIPKEKDIIIYKIFRKNNQSEKISLWGEFYSIGEVIDNLNKIKTEYNYKYFIKKVCLRFENIPLSTTEYKVMYEVITNLNENLIENNKPRLRLYRCNEELIN